MDTETGLPGIAGCPPPEHKKHISTGLFQTGTDFET